MKTRSTSARRAMTVAFGVGAALVVGIAFALWTATGSGTGSAATSNAVTATVTANTATAELYPGSDQGDLFFNVNNPNPYPVQFTGMTVQSVSSPTAGCAASNLTVTGKSGLAINVPAGATTAASIPNVAALASAVDDACQGVTFSVNVTLSGSQQGQ